jgi:hypothetical protein
MKNKTLISEFFLVKLSNFQQFFKITTNKKNWVFLFVLFHLWLHVKIFFLIGFTYMGFVLSFGFMAYFPISSTLHICLDVKRDF